MTLSIDSTFECRIRLLSTGFRYADVRFFHGRACLYFDRIELRGFGSLRAGKRAIRLDSIRDVEYTNRRGVWATTLFLTDGERLDLILRKPHLWKRRLQSRLEWYTRLFSHHHSLREPSEWQVSYGV